MNKSNFSPLSGVSESASCSKTERIHNYYNLSAAYLQGEFYSLTTYLPEIFCLEVISNYLFI